MSHSRDHSRNAINNYFPADDRDSRSPTARETPAITYPANPMNSPRPDVVQQLIDGYRTKLSEQRKRENKLIREIRDNRKEQDIQLQNIMDAVISLRNSSIPTLLQQAVLSPTNGRGERSNSDHLDTDDLMETVERDSVLGTQNVDDDNEVHWGPDQHEMAAPVANMRPQSEDPDNDLYAEPALPRSQPALVTYETPQSLGNFSSPVNQSLPSPAKTPTQRGFKRKRVDEQTSTAGPSSTKKAMAPPASEIVKQHPRSAATSSKEKTTAQYVFSRKSQRDQSVAVAAGNHPNMICTCRKLTCKICGPEEKARREGL